MDDEKQKRRRLQLHQLLAQNVAIGRTGVKLARAPAAGTGTGTDPSYSAIISAAASRDEVTAR